MQYSNAFKSSGLAAKQQTTSSALPFTTWLKITLTATGIFLCVPQIASAQYMTTDSFLSFSQPSAASAPAVSQPQVITQTQPVYQAVNSGNVIVDTPVRTYKPKKKKKVVRAKRKPKAIRVASAAKVVSTSAATSRAGLAPGEIVVYDSRRSSTPKKRKSKPRAVVNEVITEVASSRKGLRPGEVVVWDSRWSSSKKKSRSVSKKRRVRVASLGSTSVPTLTPRRSRPSYGGKITGAYSSCFPSSLRRILRNVASRFGSVHINSGYRSPRHNRRVGGARNSQHKYCRAADIKVWGVSKYTLARFLRRQPGRGSVGTYGCKSHVHVDVGPYRNWHSGCGRRRYARRYR